MKDRPLPYPEADRMQLDHEQLWRSLVLEEMIRHVMAPAVGEAVTSLIGAFQAAAAMSSLAFVPSEFTGQPRSEGEMTLCIQDAELYAELSEGGL